MQDWGGTAFFRLEFASVVAEGNGSSLSSDVETMFEDTVIIFAQLIHGPLLPSTLLHCFPFAAR
jgi:hypothetical protein